MSETDTDPRKHRRSIRLKDYDYNRGVFFVTLCIEKRACVLGEIVEGQIVLSEAGIIAQDCWQSIPDHFEHAICDAYVIMPNHIHAILALQQLDNPQTTTLNPEKTPQSRINGAGKGSLGVVLGSYKAAVTKRVNALWGTSGSQLWQRNYFERVIRNDEELRSCRNYIDQNPARWQDDQENPRFYPPS